jgi:hypothetical protein
MQSPVERSLLFLPPVRRRFSLFVTQNIIRSVADQPPNVRLNSWVIRQVIEEGRQWVIADVVELYGTCGGSVGVCGWLRGAEAWLEVLVASQPVGRVSQSSQVKMPNREDMRVYASTGPPRPRPAGAPPRPRGV